MSTTLPISTVVSVSIAAPQPGFVSPNVNNIAICTTETPVTPGNLTTNFGIYSTAAQVATDWGTTSEAYLQAVALFNQKPFEVKVHAARIAFNVIPQIGTFGADGYTDEEWKLVNETRKIMGLPDLPVCPTVVRVPVFAGHSESVIVELERPLTPDAARALLQAAPGIVVVDDPSQKRYPMPIDCAEKDAVFVGRIRRDVSRPGGLAIWVVADNLRKGAATNAVQIAELAVARGLVHGARPVAQA